MAVLINKYFIAALITLLCINTKAQDNVCVRLTDNVCKRNFVMGDTIKFSFRNVINDTVDYHLEVMMHNGKEWIYSPFYTKYFNHNLSYKKMVKMFSSKLPITFSQEDKQKSKILLPYQTASYYFIVEKKEKYKRLIKFRINAMQDCKFIYSNAFYFIRIKE